MAEHFNIHMNTTSNSSDFPQFWFVEVAADYGLVLPALYFLVVGSLRVRYLNRNTKSTFVNDKALHMAKQRRFGVRFWRHYLKLIGCALVLAAFLLRGGIVLGLCLLKDDIELDQLKSDPHAVYSWVSAQLSLVIFSSGAWAFAIYVTSLEFRSLEPNGWQLRSFWIASAICNMMQVVIFVFGEPVSGGHFLQI